jgi:hypothetical protein
MGRNGRGQTRRSAPIAITADVREGVAVCAPDGGSLGLGCGTLRNGLGRRISG